MNKEIEKNNKQDKKPDEELKGSVAAHLVIRDKQSGKEILNQRG